MFLLTKKESPRKGGFLDKTSGARFSISILSFMNDETIFLEASDGLFSGLYWHAYTLCDGGVDASVELCRQGIEETLT